MEGTRGSSLERFQFPLKWRSGKTRWSRLKCFPCNDASVDGPTGAPDEDGIGVGEGGSNDDNLHPAPTSGGADDSHDACGNNTNSGSVFRVERDENTIKDHLLANTQQLMLRSLITNATISPSSYLVMRGEVSVNVYYQTIETCH